MEWHLSVAPQSVQGGRGGKGLASRRQKVNHRKGDLHRRTDLSMDRETNAENGSALARTCPYTARPGGEPTEDPRDAVLQLDRKTGTTLKFCHISLS